MNSQNDYTNSGASYIYCDESVVNSMNPIEGPVTGSTFIGLKYGTLGDNTSCLDIPDSTIHESWIWLFEYDDGVTINSFESVISSHDSTNKILYCNTPSANLLDPVVG